MPLLYLSEPLNLYDTQLGISCAGSLCALAHAFSYLENIFKNQSTITSGLSLTYPNSFLVQIEAALPFSDAPRPL